MKWVRWNKQQALKEGEAKSLGGPLPRQLSQRTRLPCTLLARRAAAALRSLANATPAPASIGRISIVKKVESFSIPS